MKYLTGSILVALALCVAFTGCRKNGGAGADIGWDEQQFADAIARLDKAIGLFDKAISVESKEWRETLVKLEQALKTDAQDLMVNEVRSVTQAFAADLKDLPKETADYIEVKLKDNLKAMRKALAEARQDVVDAKAKKDNSGIKRALDKLADIKVFHDPVVTGFIPSNVNIEWKDHTQTDYTIRIPLIEIRGWGFERPAGEELKMAVAIEGADGKLRSLPPAVFFFTSRYLAQIKLDTAGAKILKGDHKLVLIMNTGQPGGRREVPISHKIPPVPEPKKVEPPPPPHYPLLNIGRLVDATGTTPAGTADKIVVDIIDRSTFDASATTAKEIIINDKIDGGSTVNLKALNGTVTFNGKIDQERTVLNVVAPGCKVIFNQKIDGKCKVNITARHVEINDKVDGGQNTVVTVTLPPDGFLKYKENFGTISVICNKVNPNDPEPKPGIVRGKDGWDWQYIYNGQRHR
ncbi:MAG: hypothetical protein K2P78_01580 [Gemmataceae bacterium]|nr:hypothetical protein [Gemmataceae bacterium]